MTNNGCAPEAEAYQRLAVGSGGVCVEKVTTWGRDKWDKGRVALGEWGMEGQTSDGKEKESVKRKKLYTEQW